MYVCIYMYMYTYVATVHSTDYKQLIIMKLK